MSTKRTSCLIQSFSLLCVVALSLAVVTSLVTPQLAREKFGAASPNLPAFQRTYLSVLLMLEAQELLTPKDTQGSDITFSVQLGESTMSIIHRLYQANLIQSEDALRHYLLYTGLDTTIQAGDYQLSSRMSAIEIAHALQDATPKEVVFQILAGWRAEEIGNLLPTSGLKFTREELLTLVFDPPIEFTQKLGIPAGKPLEGFLFPDLYRLPREISVEGFITILLENFQIKVDESIREGIQAQGLSLYQAVILASLIEREAIFDEEMPKIASVFLNRLASGMKLDADASVQYALGFIPSQNTWWKNPLSLEDLKIDSPYNTYLVPGLPPTPISNPGINALRAVAFPEETSFYYFRAACDGSGWHTFATTFEEHQQNACP